MALVMLGVIIAQLFRLQHTEEPDRDIGYFVLGIPLAAVLIAAGMLVLFFGAYRTWVRMFSHQILPGSVILKRLGTSSGVLILGTSLHALFSSRLRYANS